MIDIIIIGAGPAGISAGLYAKRANNNVLILYSGESNIEKAEKIDNYYGFENGISGKELYNIGIKQAQNIGIKVKREEVLHIELEENLFKVSTTENDYIAKAVIIATGNKKIQPNIKGIDEFEGKGVSYCAICDGFFYKNKNVVVIGNGEFAINEANILKKIANNVTILTNGLNMPKTQEFNVIQSKIKEIKGGLRVQKIVFEDNSYIEVDGIFIALGEAGGADFAKKMGVFTKNDSIIVDENMQTNIKGLYACGNVNGGLLQISKAVYEGAIAGLAASKYIRKEN